MGADVTCEGTSDCDALANTCEENLAEIEDIMKDGEKGDAAVTSLAGIVREELRVVETVQDMVG